jgi:polysaccharide pyruvyl transferase WcaK-like protein
MVYGNSNFIRRATSLGLLLSSTSPKVAYVGGWVGKANLGDEALVKAVERLFPWAKFWHYDGGRLTQWLHRSIPNLRQGILGAGTLIAQKRMWLDIAESYLTVGKPLSVFGTGVEDSTFWSGDTSVDDWKQVLRQCAHIGVRGPISADLLRQAGIANVEIVGDPVLCFASNEICLTPRERTLGINIGTADNRMFGDEGHVFNEAVKLAKKAKLAGWVVEWYNVWPKDLDIIRKAALESGTSDRIFCEYHNLDRFISRVRTLSVFVGLKLHATLLATCALTPALMLEYRPKCRDYMSSINQDHATIRTDVFNSIDAWDRIQDWSSRRSEVAALLLAGIQPLVDKQRAYARMLARKIGQAGGQ